MVGQGERAVAVAIVGIVAGRGDDPVVPADVVEVDVERVAPAVSPMVVIIVVIVAVMTFPAAASIFMIFSA